MIIECFGGGIVRLGEPLDFRRFKLVLHADAAPGTEAWPGITLLDDRDALVSIDLVPTLAGRPDDAGWDQRYAEMVDKAREHGWIDAERHAIRAHVERMS
ncbi:hypothetical protein XH89_28545 [Bradyrhizobium sp. CCBAU 53340]|uniref:hypothetical protein n=1 Tax=Bradyrhizobium sp. CCBAU 53340 TaxID=1325112 RepID=UPI001889F747|nr:hypothetical protein [Bradyrhizobium sp. CCBAU 53340]QOZ46987.1 hypothetical protein XH89_28545 [Bradyrhizobium sp. CCBAU 53340]